jgi:hypothetical protein
MYAMGNKLFKRTDIDLAESISKIGFRNAINYFNYHNIKGKENEDEIHFFDQKIRHYLAVLSK